MNKDPKIHIAASAVCVRYSISARTLTRRIERKQFASPIYINGRRYFAVDELDAWDAAVRAARNGEAE